MDQDRQMLTVEDNVGNQTECNAECQESGCSKCNQNPGVQNVGNQNGLSVVLEIANQYGNGNVVIVPAKGNGNGINGNPIRCYNCRGEGHYASNCTIKPRKRDAAYLQTQLQIAQKDKEGIQVNSKEFDFMAAAGAYDEIEKMVQLSVEQDGGTIDQHPVTIDETRQHGQILNETSNKAKIKKEIDVLETMNIELEHSVATLRKENETLKQHYKDLYDSIKITRSKTTEQTTSLLANNAELKAQIQEKVFAIAALKNDLRKLKGNSVDTKFDKTSVLGKPVLPSLRNQSVVRQPNAFKSARAQMSKQRFASQVDVNKNLSKPVTQHYLPKKTESTFAKPDHMIASSSSRNSSKNMPRFSSNDMVHNHYLDEARKKTQERDRNSKTSVMPSARFQSTADDRKPNPRCNNQTSRSLPVSKSSRVTITAVPKADHSKSSNSFSDSKNFVCSTCHRCVFNANHDACITKLLKEVNSRAKIQSNKTTNSNKPVDQKSHTQKPSRQIFTGHRFSPNKTSAVSEKTSPRSDLRWKPTGRIFKSVGLRWIPTGKLFDSCTSKVDSEPPHGSNVDIPHIHECKQTLDVSAGTSINVQKEQSLDLSAGTLCNVNKENLRVWLLKRMISQKPLSSLEPQCQMASDHVSSDPGPQCSTTVLEQDSLSPGPQSQENVPQVAETVTTSNELELLYSPMFSELLNGNYPVVSMSPL
ncbi:gag-pol polyprotein [Tanacetum coccineum]